MEIKEKKIGVSEDRAANLQGEKPKKWGKQQDVGTARELGVINAAQES